MILHHDCTLAAIITLLNIFYNEVVQPNKITDIGSEVGAEAEAGDDLVTGHITNTRIITAEVGAEIGDTDHGTLAKTDITHVKKKGEEVL